ncbi:MAG: DUF1801 domain-containing protein [Bacteroidota bacterium]
MTKIDPAAQVVAHLAQLDPAISPLVNEMRLFILSIDDAISEEIKWNSPSFYFNGDMKPFNPKEYKRDIVVMNLTRGKILLVFPTGARIDDKANVLEGKYTDGRKLANIKDQADFEVKKAGIKAAIIDWLSKVEK